MLSYLAPRHLASLALVLPVVVKQYQGRLPTDPNLLATSSGEEHQASIDRQGRLWVQGANHCGQLGTDDYIPCCQPYHIQLPHKAVAVACGKAHTAVLLENGDLYLTGANKQCQVSSSDRETHCLFLLASSGVRSVACGDCFTIWSDYHGKTFARGYCGFGYPYSITRTPTPVFCSGQWVTAVFARGLTAYLQSEQGLYAVGYNFGGCAGLVGRRYPNILTEPCRLPPEVVARLAL
jgi:hypothetical protein